MNLWIHLDQTSNKFEVILPDTDTENSQDLLVEDTETCFEKGLENQNISESLQLRYDKELDEEVENLTLR